MGKGNPFLEVFASALNEDYRFPILEVFAFLYALGTFVFANIAGTLGQFATSEDAVAFSLVNSLTGLPVFIFVILILKNIAYGLGSELEKRVTQTFLSYPLKRRLLMTAKLLSSIGVALLLFLGIQVFALFILAPDIVSPHMDTVLLTYLGSSMLSALGSWLGANNDSVTEEGKHRPNCWNSSVLRVWSSLEPSDIYGRSDDLQSPT